MKYLSIYIIFVCWLPQLVDLFPLPQLEQAHNLSTIAQGINQESIAVTGEELPDESSYSAEQIYKDMWIVWSKKLIIILFGISSGLLAFLNIKKCRVFVALSSLVYLFVWYKSASTAPISFVDSYLLRYKTALQFDELGNFMYEDVVLPVSFVLIIAFLLYQQLASRNH